MCSVQEEGDVLHPERRHEYSESMRKCMKCALQAVVIIRMNDAMCSECFTSYTTHKFRSAFGKSKLVRDQEKVIVAYSGGQSSSAMVHLIQGGLSKRAQKKLRFMPSLLYIDEGAVTNQTVEERISTTLSVLELMKASGLSFNVFCLEQAMTVLNLLEISEKSTASCSCPLIPLASSGENQFEQLNEQMQLTKSAEQDLHKLLNGTKTLTAKQNLIKTLRFQLLVSIARQQNVSKVLLGDCASRLSVRLLSNIAQGQGAHLPYEISFADTRFNDVLLIRPMREFTAKEVTMYNNLNKVDNVFVPNLSTKASSQSSIELLTEEFVTGLQTSYPNTVSTIFRTGEKFDLTQMKVDSEERCCMCQCPLDTAVGISSALNATKFSQNVCSNMADRTSSHQSNPVSIATEGAEGCRSDGSCHEDKACCDQVDGSCGKSKELTRSDLDGMLCYGCQLITRDLTSVADLPIHITEEALRQRHRSQMKTEIADFLISD